jgi:hypothetical protein
MKLFQSCLNLVRELLVDVIVIQVCSLLFIINVFVKKKTIVVLGPVQH